MVAIFVILAHTQQDTMEVKKLSETYPDAKIIGHNEISKKECPSFDVQQWKADNL
jgi:quinolinate synthase